MLFGCMEGQRRMARRVSGPVTPADLGTVLRPAPDLLEASWRHVLTVPTIAAASECAQGTTVWAAVCGGMLCVLCWQWTEVRPTVLAAADIRAVASNAYPTAPGGEVLAPPDRRVLLARIVASIDWQTTVRAEMARHWTVRRAGSPAGASADTAGGTGQSDPA